MKPFHLLPAALVCGLLTAVPAHSQNTAHTPGDLVLFFQNPSGSTGANRQVFASLGNTATVIRQAYVAGQNLTNIANINSVMTNAYGTNWASISTLWGGLGGVWSTSEGSGLQNGDPARTVYSSMPRAGVGTPGQTASTQLTFNTDTGITTCANSVFNLGNIFETGATTQVAIVTNGVGTTVGSIHPIDEFGAGTSWNGTVAAPGVQQQGSAATFGTFGPFTNVEFLWDLYRVQPRNNIAGQFGQGAAIRQGLFLGTLVLTTSGAVHFVSAAPTATPYEMWAGDYGLDPLLASGPTAGSRSADPDGDGLNNFQEFAFGGDPTKGSAAALSAARSGTSTVLTSVLRNADITSFVLQSRTSLTAGSWTNSGLSPVAAGDQNGVPAGYTRFVYTSAAGPTSLFFRMSAVE